MHNCTNFFAFFDKSPCRDTHYFFFLLKILIWYWKFA